MTHWLQRIGQSDSDTFASLIAKLGNNTTAFWTAVGYEGATSLAAKLTALRAGYLDELDFDLNARLGAPAGASLSADLLTIDNLVDDLEAAVGAIEGATTLHNKLTAARAAFLDAAITSRATTGEAAAALAAVAYTRQVGVMQAKPTTVDIGQIAGTYDLFTATTQDVVVESLVIRMSGGAGGGNLTSISIQTDDATPQVFISVVQGAVANLTNEAQLAWTGAILLDAGTSAKIQITLAGGAASAARVCDVVATCRAAVTGGYLT